MGGGPIPGNPRRFPKIVGIMLPLISLWNYSAHRNKPPLVTGQLSLLRWTKRSAYRICISLNKLAFTLQRLDLFFFFICPGLCRGWRMHLQHMEVPRIAVLSELVAAGLYHSHRNTCSELRLWPTYASSFCNIVSLTHWVRPGIEHGYYLGLLLRSHSGNSLLRLALEFFLAQSQGHSFGSLSHGLAREDGLWPSSHAPFSCNSLMGKGVSW